MRDLVMSAEKESSDVPESLAGVPELLGMTLTGASSLWWRRSSVVRRPVSLHPAQPEALWPVCGISVV